MKIQTRFILCFAAVVLVMVGVLSVYVNLVLVDRVRNEKAEEYRHYVRQLATSVYLTTRETEQAFFNQYNSRNVADALLSDQKPVAKAMTMQPLLSTIPLNVPNVQAVLTIDLEGNRFFAGKLPENQSETIERIVTPELYETFTRWLTDDAGCIFLKKDVYQVFPLRYAGVIIAQMDTPKLLSALGMEMQVDGMLAVVTEQGTLLAQTGGMSRELFDRLIAAEPLKFREEGRAIMLEGREYWLAVDSAVNQSWYALQLVPVETMLAMPNSLSRILWLGSVCIILLALLLSSLVTRSISGNAKKLLASMAETSRGNFEAPIEVRSRDEIGELAGRFRWMQEELKTVTGKMILRATEKQQAEYELLELKYRSLLAQISPHFLCNVLSTINALALMGNNGDVSRLSVSAARYLRDHLNTSDRKFTTLGQEIRFVEEYVELYSLAYRNSCAFEVDVADETVESRVPNMLLQPLVENALVHGRPLDGGEQTHHVRVVSRMEGETLIIQVENDGQCISEEVIEMVERAGTDQEFSKRMKGFGLRGVLQRLRLLYGEKQSLHISSAPGEWTVITIRLPFESGEEDG